jgi:hypothetical protein
LVFLPRGNLSIIFSRWCCSNNPAAISGDDKLNGALQGQVPSVYQNEIAGHHVPYRALKTFPLQLRNLFFMDVILFITSLESDTQLNFYTCLMNIIDTKYLNPDSYYRPTVDVIIP